MRKVSAMYMVYDLKIKDGEFFADQQAAAHQPFISSLHSGALHRMNLNSVHFLYVFNTTEFNSTPKFYRKIRTGIKIRFSYFP